MLERVKELLEEKNYKAAKVELNKLNSSDVAELLEDIDAKEIVKIFRLINKDKAADVFSYLPVEHETELIGPFFQGFRGIGELEDKRVLILIDEGMLGGSGEAVGGGEVKFPALGDDLTVL